MSVWRLWCTVYMSSITTRQRSEKEASDRLLCVLVQWGEAHLTLARAQTELGEYQHALRSFDRCAVRPILPKYLRGSSAQGRVTCNRVTCTLRCIRSPLALLVLSFCSEVGTACH